MSWFEFRFLCERYFGGRCAYFRARPQERSHLQTKAKNKAEVIHLFRAHSC